MGYGVPCTCTAGVRAQVEQPAVLGNEHDAHSELAAIRVWRAIERPCDRTTERHRRRRRSDRATVRSSDRAIERTSVRAIERPSCGQPGESRHDGIEYVTDWEIIKFASYTASPRPLALSPGWYPSCTTLSRPPLFTTVHSFRRQFPQGGAHVHGIVLVNIAGSTFPLSAV